MDLEHCFKAIHGIKVCQLFKMFNAGKIKIGCNVCGVKYLGQMPTSSVMHPPKSMEPIGAAKNTKINF
jgi:hypothetical protein